MTELVLGPLLRYIDDTRATVWVETDGPCTVEILGATAPTFQVGGHYYALVVVEGLRSGTSYEVRLDDQLRWPLPGAPASRIRPLSQSGEFRLLFGSCHFERAESTETADERGPDALAAVAARLPNKPDDEWPDALLLLGDQVYADETSPALRRKLAARRDLRRPPGPEVADFEEYTLLYQQSWTDPAIRWLLSTVPAMMIFDDHDVRDDWNTSRHWRRTTAAEAWWPERIQGALIAYWIYQHIGNLAPEQLAQDETYQKVIAGPGDALPVLREFACQADREDQGEKSVRWSYFRDLGPARLIVLDTRCGRILETGDRAMLSPGTFDWLTEATADRRDHLLLASSLPWLLPPAIHHLQSWNEAACEGRFPRLAEAIRQAGDLEHWAAFRSSFDRLTAIIHEVASRDDAPASISVLSGDVHHSYCAEARFPRPVNSRILQVVCSALHNPAPRFMLGPLRAAWSRVASGIFRRRASRAGVAPLPVEWGRVAGPFFDNAVCELSFDAQRGEVRILGAVTDDRLSSMWDSWIC